MTAVWELLLSPWGLAAYAAFWALKLLCGAWLLRRALTLLPDAGRVWAEHKLGLLRLRRW